MRKLFPMILVLVFVQFAFGQKNISWNKLIKESQNYLEAYSKVSPYDSRTYSFKELGLTKKDQQEILSKESDLEYIGPDSLGNFDAIYFLQEKIMERIERIVRHPEFLENDIYSLLGNTELSIVSSEDGKLFNFSLDEKTGGSYRSRISIMHFTENEFLEENTEEREKWVFEEFNSDGYDAIHSIDTEEGTKYVLFSSVRGCSYCFETSVELMAFENTRFVTEFEYTVNSRHWEGGVFYDPDKRSIHVSYVTDDLTPYCSCYSPEFDQEMIYDEEQNKRQKCECQFEFDGINFQMTKASWELIKEISEEDRK